MSSTPLNEGFLPTSTPIHPPNDSGFFSCDKLPLDKRFNTLSPIKEISNYKKINEVAETPYIHFNYEEVARELDFSNSVDFSASCTNEYAHGLDSQENASLSSFLSFHINLSDRQKETFSNREPSITDLQYYNVDNIVLPCDTDKFKDQFVNCKTSFKPRNKIDFFKRFQRQNLCHITSFLLSLLHAEDLCHLSCVSKNWRKTVQDDVKAECRRKAFLKDKYSQKENQNHPASSLRNGPGDNNLCVENKTVLYNKCNFPATLKQPLKSNAATKFESFVKEGAQGSSNLMKCPVCNYAAKNQIGNIYLCTECKYAFCQCCWNPYFKNHTCCMSKKVSIVIGSKKSKRNLKRLLT